LIPSRTETIIPKGNLKLSTITTNKDIELQSKSSPVKNIQAEITSVVRVVKFLRKS
jgi:cytoskeletal protein CcmA (bactofilin family)